MDILNDADGSFACHILFPKQVMQEIWKVEKHW